MNEQIKKQNAMITLGSFINMLIGCKSQINITKLIDDTRTDWRAARKYTDLLLQAKLLKKENNLFSLTDDGFKLVQLLCKIDFGVKNKNEE